MLYGPDDVAYIITGVPRSDRDPEYFARLQRESERADYETPNKPLAYQPPVETKNIPPLPKPAPQPERPPEPQQIRTQVRRDGRPRPNPRRLLRRARWPVVCVERDRCLANRYDADQARRRSRSRSTQVAPGKIRQEFVVLSANPVSPRFRALTKRATVRLPGGPR